MVKKTMADFELEVFYDTIPEPVAAVTGNSGSSSTSTKDKHQKKLEEQINLNTNQWSIINPGQYTISRKNVDKIPAGLYTPSYSTSIGYYLDEKLFSVHDLLFLPKSPISKILDEFKDFWALKPKFDERGFVHKRGYLFWGPPGSGKTSLINLMILEFIENYDGIVVVADTPEYTSGCLEILRKVEKDRPIIVVIEDFDAAIKRKGEDIYLQLLDGNLQMNSIVFIATTNYPSLIDKRFIARPSRFDTIQQVGMPSKEARIHFLKNKEPSLTEEELAKWIKYTDEFSIAHLKELIIAVKCLGQPFEEAVKRITSMTKTISDDNPDRARSGFF